MSFLSPVTTAPTTTITTVTEDSSLSSREPGLDETLQVVPPSPVPPLFSLQRDDTVGHIYISASPVSSSSSDRMQTPSASTSPSKKNSYRKLLDKVAKPLSNSQNKPRRERSISANNHSNGSASSRDLFSKVCKTFTPRPKEDTSHSPKSNRKGSKQHHRRHNTHISSSDFPREISLSDPTSSSSSLALSNTEIYGCLLREFNPLRKYLTGTLSESVEDVSDLAVQLLMRYRGNEMTVIRFIFDAAKEMPKENQARLDHLLYLIHTRLDPKRIFLLPQPNNLEDPTSFFFFTRALAKQINEIVANSSCSPRKAAQRIFSSLQNHSEYRCTIAHFISYAAKDLSKKNQERFKNLLFYLFMNPVEVSFFADLWRCLGINRDEVAHHFITIVYVNSIDLGLFFELVTKHTEFELTHQTLETLFREDNFSSLLCKHFGLRIEEERLDPFYNFILSNLDSLSIDERSRLCIDMRYLRQHASLDPQLSPDETEQIVQSLSATNISHFLAFSSKIIKKFHTTSFSPHFCYLLKIRRQLIETFICNQTPPSAAIAPSELSNLSRIYIGEIIFLRMLCGKLFGLARNDQEKTILVSLSKLFQQLANETELGEQHPMYMRKGFNRFCTRFRSRHRAHIDALCKG